MIFSGNPKKSDFFPLQNYTFKVSLFICGQYTVHKDILHEKCKWTFRIRNLSSVNKSDSDQIPLGKVIYEKEYNHNGEWWNSNFNP